MIKKSVKYIICLIIVFYVFVNKAQASVSINEIEINPTEERFIELYNNDTSSVDLTDWYIQRKTSTGASYGSLVSKTNFQGKSIEANSYFIISKNSLSNSDIVYDGLTLTESNSIQLKNSEGNVVDKIGWGDSTDCGGICAPNPTEGKSIGKDSSGNWVIASPTPKIKNSESINIDNNISSDSSSTSSSSTSSGGGSYSSSSTPKKEIENFKIITKIIIPKTVTATIPFSIDHITTGTKKEKIILGKFIWNFGDGMSKEGAISDPFDYFYQYPGDYVVTLSYYNNIFETIPIATDRVTIKVISSGVNILSVGTLSDPYIEIENNSNYEIALYKWIIKGSNHSFVIPEGMIILPNKKLKLSPKITGFTFDDLNSITIMNSSGEIFASYPNKIQKNTKYFDTSISQEKNNQTELNINKKDDIKQVNEKEGYKEVINLNDLSANASGVSSLDKSTYSWLGLIFVIIIGIISVILLRNKKDYPDYIDKEISAKDMTIIE